MIEINLIPDVKRELLRAQAWRSLIVAVSGLISAGAIALAVITFGTVISTNGIISSNEGSIKEKFAKIAQVQDAEATVTLQNQLSEISAIRNASPNTSRILNQILYSVRPSGDNEVSYTVVDYETETRIMTIEGETSNQFKSVEALKKTIAETEIYYRTKTSSLACNDKTLSAEDAEEDEKHGLCLKASLIEEGTTVDILEHTSGEDSDGRMVVRYRVQFTLNPLALRFSSKNLGVKSPSKKDVTDSRTEIPDDIFKNSSTDNKQEEIQEGAQ